MERLLQEDGTSRLMLEDGGYILLIRFLLSNFDDVSDT